MDGQDLDDIPSFEGAGAYCFEPTIPNNDAVDSSESESSVAYSESELDSSEEDQEDEQPEASMEWYVHF